MAELLLEVLGKFLRNLSGHDATADFLLELFFRQGLLVFIHSLDDHIFHGLSKTCKFLSNVAHRFLPLFVRIKNKFIVC